MLLRGPGPILLVALARADPVLRRALEAVGAASIPRRVGVLMLAEADDLCSRDHDVAEVIRQATARRPIGGWSQSPEVYRLSETRSHGVGFRATTSPAMTGETIQ